MHGNMNVKFVLLSNFHFLWNPNAYYQVHYSLTLVPTPSQF